MDDAGSGPPALTDRLEVLFALVPVPEGAALYSDERAASDLTAAGTAVTADELRRLRSGDIVNPAARLLTGLAGLFGVPDTYFSDDQVAERVGEQLRLLVRLRDAGVRSIAGHHGEQVSAAALTAILDQLEQQPRP